MVVLREGGEDLPGEYTRPAQQRKHRRFLWRERVSVWPRCGGTAVRSVRSSSARARRLC